MMEMFAGRVTLVLSGLDLSRADLVRAAARKHDARVNSSRSGKRMTVTFRAHSWLAANDKYKAFKAEPRMAGIVALYRDTIG